MDPFDEPLDTVPSWENVRSLSWVCEDYDPSGWDEDEEGDDAPVAR